MKSFLLPTLCAMIMMLCAAPSFAQTPTNTFSLRDALKYAYERNPAFRSASVDEQISAEKTNEALTRYYPRLVGTVDFRNNTQLPTSILPARAFNPTAAENEFQEIKFGTNWNATAALDLTQPVLDFGIGAEIAAAKAAQTLASATTQRAKNDLTVGVARAYYTVLLNQEKLRQAEVNFIRNENFYKDVQAKFQNANALKTDQSRAYLNVSNAGLQRKKAQDAVQTSLANLALQLGWEGNTTDIRLTDNLASVMTQDSTFANRSLEAALDSRPDVRSETAQREVNVQNLQRSRSQNLPTLSAFGYLSTQGFANELSSIKFFPLSYVGVRLNVPIADWFTRTPVIQQQALQLDRNENTMRTLRQTAVYELANTQLLLKNAWQNARIQQENIAIAEEVVSTTTARYKQGQATQQEVLDAESTLRETQLSYLQAVYDALVAKLDWEKANGMM
jgi:outer membrane protein